MVQQSRSLIKRLAAFVGLWCMGVGTLAVVAYIIKLVIL